MEKSENKLMRKRLFGAYASSIISISLVLLLIGVATLLLVNARGVADYFKERLQISVIFDQQVTETEAKQYCKTLESEPYINHIDYISKEQGVKEMEDLLGADFLSVFDSAPVPISLGVSLKAEYVEPGMVEKLMKDILQSPYVEDVVWQKSLVEKLNANLRTISMVLGVFIFLMLFISVFLIGNTVRLNLFSKRFTIHTMRLVGATKAFIRRPFLAGAFFQGVISAELASIILLGLLLAVKVQFEELFQVFHLHELLLVLGVVMLAGIVLCELATFVVVSRMVTLKNEELYL